MVYFVTKRQFKIAKPIIVIDDIYRVIQYLKYISIIGFDCETNGLDAYMNKVLLLIVGDAETQFVIDTYCYDLTELNEVISSKTLLGHNLKFDYCMTKIQCKLELKDMTYFDTMIAEQRLTQGLPKANSKRHISGISYKLDALVAKYKGDIPIYMDKKIRNEFIGANPETFIFSNRHINYAAADIESLFIIKEEQEKLINSLDLQRLIYDIEMPYIEILAESELCGLDWNKDKWLEIVKVNEKKQYQIELDLDSFIKVWQEEQPDNLLIKGGKFNTKRYKPIKYSNIGLFGDTIGNKELWGNTAKLKQNTNCINWGSTSDIVDLFARIGKKLPYKNNGNEFTVIYKTPKFIGNDKKSLDKTNFTTQEKYINEYLIEGNLSFTMKSFFETIIKHREVSTELENYGENYIDKVNPVTGHIHTIYRQCFAINGRLQSGGGLKQPDRINIQNLPRKSGFRECFYIKGHKLVGCDYSGAEAVTTGDFANDLNFLTHIEDLHSYLATACWREIYKSRADKARINSDLREELLNLSTNIVISKTEYKELRQSFKNCTFGVIYKAGAKTIAKTLNITEDEGKIVINTFWKLIPKVMQYMNNIENTVKKYGYLRVNNRTNSIIWCKPVLDIIKQRTSDRLPYDWEVNIPESMTYSIAKEFRNYKISATQADFMKEAGVELYREFKSRSISAKILLFLHDEHQIAIPDEIIGTKINFVEDSFTEDMRTVLIPEFISLTMNKVANRYLTNVKMNSEYAVHDVWAK